MPDVLVAGSERREDKNKEINDGCRWFTQIEKPVCQIHHAAWIKFQLNFAVSNSRADYWNGERDQIAINEFISPLMKGMHEQVGL